MDVEGIQSVAMAVVPLAVLAVAVPMMFRLVRRALLSFALEPYDHPPCERCELYPPGELCPDCEWWAEDGDL